jgi:hypothetical protein
VLQRRDVAALHARHDQPQEVEPRLRHVEQRAALDALGTLFPLRFLFLHNVS